MSTNLVDYFLTFILWLDWFCWCLWFWWFGLVCEVGLYPTFFPSPFLQNILKKQILLY